MGTRDIAVSRTDKISALIQLIFSWVETDRRAKKQKKYQIVRTTLQRIKIKSVCLGAT